MDASRGMSPKSTAASAPGGHQTGRVSLMGGTAVAVTTVPSPSERRSHAEGQHLELRKSEGERGGASASSPVPFMRWVL